MKRLIVVFIVYITVSFSFFAKADEGMWLLSLIEKLNSSDMKDLGFKLTAQDIYNVNNSSMKDAIIVFDERSCTGSMVSEEGLMLINHHCAYPYVQKHSTIESDYIKDGFWAMDRIEELRNDGISATFLVRMEDVTDKILSQLTPGMTEEERTTKIEEASAKLQTEATDGTHYSAQVKSFYNGNQFFLLVNEVFRDVRLVFSPPETIGDFGGETDNWMWPRHKADFALFRIYMSPEGEPAPYNKKNIPYKPKYHFPISIKGVEKDDFAMVLGYPGQTTRFMTSHGVKTTLEKLNPAIVKVRTKKLELMKQDMDANEEVNLQYISKYAKSANYWKYYKLQNEILKELDVYNKKIEIENDFTKWINADSKRKEKYGTVLDEISKAYDEANKYLLSVIYFGEAIKSGAEILEYAQTFEELYEELKLNINEEKIYRLPKTLTYDAKKYFKSYNLETDKKLFIALVTMFYEDVPKEQHPDIFQTIEKKYKGSIGDFANDLYEKSIFSGKDKVLNFLMEPDYKKLDKDLGFITMRSFYTKYKEIKGVYDKAKLLRERGNRLFIAGVMEMQKNKKFYPDANSTLRLTYGKVTDYKPSKDVYHTYYTTLDEYIAKENPNNPEFFVPEKLKILHQSKNYGKYAYKDGSMRVCFITDNDVTGGNSGSPTLNGNGEIIGIVFDINCEASSSPIAFNSNLQRTINTDIKFVLFIIDKYAGAMHLIQEMTIKE